MNPQQRIDLLNSIMKLMELHLKIYHPFTDPERQKEYREMVTKALSIIKTL